MNPFLLTVYESPFPKRRIGKDYDGGYVIAEVPGVQYKLCLAGGVFDDVSFEENFCDLYPDSVCYAFDGTVEAPPEIRHPNVTFVKKNIGQENGEGTTNLHGLIEEHTDIFVKMDIEGWEIPWISSLLDVHMDKIEQMVIEFHFPFGLAEHQVFTKINKSHKLVHFHANNNCGIRIVNGIAVPNVFECTYVHNRHFAVPPGLNTEPIPSNLDMRNVETLEELRLCGPPFVHKNSTCHLL